MHWIFAALAALIFSGSSGGSRSKKVTTGTAMLKGGRAYRIELEVSGQALNSKPTEVAQGVDNGLRMNGAYDVLVQPTIPLLVSYSIVPAGDVPIVLNVPAQQTIGGMAADYTFRSVEQIATTRRAA